MFSNSVQYIGTQAKSATGQWLSSVSALLLDLSSLSDLFDTINHEKQAEKQFAKTVHSVSNVSAWQIIYNQEP